jgi:hypothetical protein
VNLPARLAFRKRVAVTRDKLEEIAFSNRTQIHVDHASNVASTRVDGVEFFAELGDVW